VDRGDFGVVGGGLLGLAVARRLLELRPGASVTVLEKEGEVARHQSSHNSGVAHAGVYYPAGSLKAELCRRGVGLLKEYCAEHDLPFSECGKLVVALDGPQVVRLDAIEDRARANGVPGLRRLTGDAIREVEPEVAGVAALHSPTTAIVDFAAVARALGRDVAAAGGEVVTGFEVERIEDGTAVVVGSGRRIRRFGAVVICAGLHTDRVAALAGGDAEPRIVAFRGEYHRLLPERSHLVRGLVYPVPDPRLPFLGVHFTRRVGGGVDVGPNAVLALSREGYRRRDVSVRDLLDTLAWPGTWRMARRYPGVAVAEALTSLSRRQFVRRARAYVPVLQVEDLAPVPAGVRAQAVARDGALVDDFVLRRHGQVLAVRNAPSPAATSSLAIAERICAELLVP
jgi:L-2-hydroxyglutarate oxidase LhgO